MIKMVHEYRDRIYIRKDILLKLYDHDKLNQSKLMSYCGLNNVKHKEILDDMVKKEMINKIEEAWGSKNIINYKISEKGREILKEVLEPYESLFPRNESDKSRLNVKLNHLHSPIFYTTEPLNLTVTR
jgi:predicted transcriptional regulator